ncbi:hypothetical protein D8B26_003899 [Coccidioides posadasii str. Silveira]|uniref:NADH dehydrogenase [ubiquinone] 1 alpha subcomplex assembly factor 3 n=1 Tax=Coccidioides posadasii (strain RMSCC 757 / Silveira) TaxID=443226 RepID=E9D9A7_COCPS|nr:hypothetical protein CPSG_06409 [Coccidioides posadasii str. Silveira]QVM09235.1 hypothetical protein D8B26_003899 [Coccidioides posadasii str. Silveira]
MHSPSTQLLRILRASITSSERAIAQQPHLRRCPVSRPANPPFIVPISQQHRAISSSVALNGPESSNHGGNGRQPPLQPPRRAPPPQPRRRTELTTADLKPKTRYRGPPPPEDSDTNTSMRTDLGALDVFANVAAPSTAIDACLEDGFHLNNGVKITDGSGCLLVDGEVFAWKPWEAGKGAMVNEKGQWEVAEEAWGVLSLVWPKPDLLILGLGRTIRPISPETRRHINQLGIRIEIQDTRNAAAQFNLLATERGVREVAAALIPLGRKG